MESSALFRPLTIKSLRLSNRIVMAPMTRYFSPGGVPTADVAAYYRRRATAGVGLILSEGTGIDRPASLYDPDVPQFHGERALAAWTSVIDGVHAAGGRMGIQLWHVGALHDPSRTCSWMSRLESPSGLAAPGKAVGVAMTESAIADTIDAYARAAAEAERLGFDCVEIHGAHGYLLDQFFWDKTNVRTGRYGGATLAERSRFAVEIVKAMRKAVSEDFPISLRLSQWKQQDFSVKLAPTPDALAAWLMPLADAGVDIFHCSQRRFWEPEFPGSELNFAGWAKSLTGKHTITVGSVGLNDDFLSMFSGKSSAPASLMSLIQRLEWEEFDLVAVGRALLTDAEWAAKVRERRTGELRGFQMKALESLT
jgi:2,4-dienoyl-CoA reductase-like NADH-dependent reductase (Old Yellow Enzyme family)